MNDTSKDDELYQKIEAYENYRLENYRRVREGTINPQTSMELVKANRDEFFAFIKLYGTQERKNGYIDGVNSDKRNAKQIALENTVQSLENLKLYAQDCTFGRSFVGSHSETAIPIKSIQSRIDYFTTQLTALKDKQETK
jgi:hypothetical protein